MKQLSQNLRTGKLSLDEVPVPSLLAGQVLVKAVCSVISAGTERTKIETGRKSLLGKALARPDQVRQVINTFKQFGFAATYQKVMTKLDAPSPLGYSAAGIVLAVGQGVSEFHPGDAVACGGANAAHAEVFAVPRNLCVKVPKDVSLDHAAFATLGAIAMQGVRQAGVSLGECVVVIGLGLVGQLTVQILKASGCCVIGFDPVPDRCALAQKLGADAAVSSEGALTREIAHQTESHGADAVIITAGTASDRPIALSGEISRDKGRVVVVGAVGLKVPREPYYMKELDLRLSRSYGPGRYDESYEEKGQDYPYGYVRWTEKRNMGAFLALVASGKVSLAPLITHRFKLEQADEAYQMISGKTTAQYLGVLFEYAAQLPDASLIIRVGAERAVQSGQVGIGVIGAGNFAQSMLLPHLKTNPHSVLCSVVTTAPLQSRDVAVKFGFGAAVSSTTEVLQDKQVQAVLIATRHDSHAPLVVEALRAGKAIHVEKPLAMNDDELDEIIRVYKEAAHQPFLMVGFNRRFAPMVQAMERFFAKRTEPLAMQYRINAGYIPLDHWTQDLEQGGGRIIGEVCHFIDLLQFFAKSPVQQVYAHALPNLGKYRDDNVAINLVFKDGSIGNILYVANGDKSLPKEAVEVFGEGKVAVLEDYHKVTLIAGGRVNSSNAGGQNKGHAAEMAAWVDAIRLGQPEPVPFEYSVAATRASFAVIKSLSTDQPVKVE